MPRLLLLPALVPVVAGVWLALEGGGYAVDGWGAAGVLCLLALIAAVWVGPERGLSRWQLSAPAALTLLGCLGLCSIAWAAWPQSALVESGRTLVYAAVMATAVICGADERLRRLITLAVGGGAALVALELAVRMSAAGDPGSLFSVGRLVGSIGYGGGTAAAAAIGAWPLAALACDRERAWYVRLACGAGAGMCAAVVIPTEARAALVALVLGALVFVCVSPRNLASGWVTVVIGCAIAAQWAALNGAFPDASTAEIHTAGRSVIAVGCAAALAVLITLAVERWMHTPPGAVVMWITAAALIVVGVGAAAELVRTHSHPESWARGQWHAFIYEGNPTGGDTRFDSVGGGRYDLWRVAVITFHQKPIDGVGAGSFGAAYDRLGRSALQPQQAHSEPLEMLATLGIAGGLLLIAALGLPIAAAVVVRSSEVAVSEQLLAAGLAAGLSGFCAQASVDWIWHLGAVGFPAMVLGGTALAALAPDEERARSRVATGLVIAAALAVALLVVIPAALAQHYLTESLHEPLGPALRDADRAAQFDRLSGRPALARARAELAAGLPRRALADARDAVAAEPEFWGSWQTEYLAAGRAGELALSRRAWRRARLLAPHSPLVYRLAVPPFD